MKTRFRNTLSIIYHIVVMVSIPFVFWQIGNDVWAMEVGFERWMLTGIIATVAASTLLKPLSQLLRINRAARQATMANF